MLLQKYEWIQKNQGNYAVGVTFALPFKTLHKNFFIHNKKAYCNMESLQWDPGVASRINILWFDTNLGYSEDHCKF